VGALGVVLGGSIVLLLVLAGARPAPGDAPLSAPAPGGSSPPRASIGIAVAELVPSALTVEAGANGSLELWVGSGDPTCAVETPVVVWELAPTFPPIGVLASPSGPSDSFDAFPGVTGTVGITATVEGWVLCGAQNVSFGTEAQASVTTVEPLEVENFTAGGATSAPGALVTCSGLVTGGEPPYRIDVQFGDGNSSSELLAAPGEFSLGHRYAVGSYRPSVSVEDALYDRTSAQVESAVLVADALAAEVEPVGPGPEAGAPFPVEAIAEGGYPPYSFLWSDSAGDAGTGANWTIASAEPGPLAVELLATDRLGEAVEVARQFAVAPPVTARVAGENGDVGRPLLLRLNLTGGVPPFSVTGTPVPSGSSFAFTAYADGNWSEAVVPSVAASLWLSLEVTDALGRSWSETLPLAEVHAAPYLLANLTPSPDEAGGLLDVVGLAGGGTPPFNWSIASTADLAGAEPRYGRLPTGGVFAWNGTVTAPGSGELVVSLIDSSGAEVSENLSVRALPALAGALLVESAGPAAGAPLPLSYEISGGQPPYRYAFALSDGASFAGNLSDAGPGAWTAPAPPAGFLEVRLTVSDALGFRNVTTLTLAVAPATGGGSAPAGPATAPGSSGDAAGWAGWLFLPVAALIGGLWFFRSRRSAPPAPAAAEPKGALPTVRRLLREMDGLDAESLELLAEEEGVDPESSRRALERWIALGRVECVEEPEESAVYRWKEATGRGVAAVRGRGEGAP
jgi:hypothetical protein